MKPGQYMMDVDEYHADPCPLPSLSKSVMHELLTRSPEHAWTMHPRLGAQEGDEAETLDLGTAAHAMLLENDRSRVVIVDAPDWRTKAARELRDSARAEGKLPILERHWGAVEEMIEAARAQLARHEIGPIMLGLPEQTLVWQDGPTWCRCRCDWLAHDRKEIIDYKTTDGSAEPGAWIRAHLFADGGDLQAAWYRRGVYAIHGIWPRFRFVVQERNPPYALSVIEPTPAVYALAEKKIERGVALWRECLRTQHWPGYPARICYAELPGWEETRWLDREIREEVEREELLERNTILAAG